MFIVLTRSVLLEGFEQTRRETPEDLEFVRFNRLVVIGGIGDDAGVEAENGDGGSDIALERFGHQRLNQCALLADATVMPLLADGDWLAEFGCEIGCKIAAAIRAAFRVT
jgi:hypothetical protein